jgi:6-phospho-beta-glucosidase
MTDKPLKVAVIGGGSTYSPELVNGFLARTAAFPLHELVIMDISPERLEVVGGFVRRMVEARGAPFRVTVTDNQREAIRDARYVVTQLRVGMMQARRADEYLGMRHGLIGQETTGVGGMAKALRTIPVILNVARDMHELAPGALLVNFTNPAGLVTEALTRYAPGVTAVGLCNVPIHAKMNILHGLAGQGMQVDETRVELKTLGLNHLSWHYGFTVDGEDIWSQVFEEYLKEVRAAPDSIWDAPTLENLRMMPNPYLQYFYYTEKKLAEQKKWPPSRAEQVMEIEAATLRQYADPQLTEPPPELMKRGGAYYSTVATQLLHAHYNNTGETHVVNLRHDGAVPGWDPSWVLEMPARVDAAGIHPLPTEPLPNVALGLISGVKAYELLTVEAAVHGDRRAAYEALLVHPLGPRADQVQTVLDDLLETHRAYLPQFWS